MKKSITYKDAGVNIEEGDNLVYKIKSLTKNMKSKNLLSEIGGFGGAYNLLGYKNPVLISGTDGVGTKLKLAFLLDKHDTVGIDLVAMCVNDIITSGAKPLFFLDYFATGKLSTHIAEKVIKGIVNGCEQSECILLGGETAEMPNFYKKDEYDLAGFVVGAVEKDDILDGSKIKKNDVLIAIPSSGIHSNGFSLVRKVFNKKDLVKYSDILLRPTKIYWEDIKVLLRKNYINGISHITGGGLPGNTTRFLPKNSKLDVIINKNSIKTPEIFKIIQKKGNIEENEMFNVFNMGVGMVISSSKKNVDYILKSIKGSYIIGHINNGSGKFILNRG